LRKNINRLTKKYYVKNQKRVNPMIRIAINGFGRIGRHVLKIALQHKDINIIAINDLTQPKTLAHLFKYDSVYGMFQGNVLATENSLIINNKKIRVYSERGPEQLPWKELKIDVVVESTGLFRTYDGANKHIKAGAKKVLISAPAKGEKPIDKTLVLGVNHKEYNKNKHNIVSNASCTTNCLAPMVKVLNDAFGIKQGIMTTIHAYTSDQALHDRPHKDLRRGRAGAINIVPTTTGAAKAVTEVIPELKDRLNGMAIRVPVIVGSIVDLTVQLKKKTNVNEINLAFKKASHSNFRDIILYSEEALVSSDIIRNSHSFSPRINCISRFFYKSKSAKLV
jgi:glyceraldehyde-3-phosphate dehydrogenase type I